MKDIEKILKNAANQEIQVPAKIHYRVQNVLKEKKQEKIRNKYQKISYFNCFCNNSFNRRSFSICRFWRNYIRKTCI